MSDKPVLFVSFSGGRTSGYMCHWLQENKSSEYELIFVFANTGQEHERTLEFVDRCDKEFGLNLVWVEAVINPIKNKGTGFVVVDFETACRDVRLFEDMVKVYGIPNMGFPHCNRELKIAAIKSYKASLGFKREHLMAVGIRIDESDRMSYSALEAGELTYPLVKWARTTKAEVRHWWSCQSFDLRIDEHQGNCNTCHKKSDRKLYTLAKNSPELFEPFDYLERTYSHVPIEGQVITDRVFFRNHRSSATMVSEANTIDFVEFVDYVPEMQLNLLDGYNPLDVESDCGSSCEAQ